MPNALRNWRVCVDTASVGHIPFLAVPHCAVWSFVLGLLREVAKGRAGAHNSVLYRGHGLTFPMGCLDLPFQGQVYTGNKKRVLKQSTV